jgi:hypothetical protein
LQKIYSVLVRNLLSLPSLLTLNIVYTRLECSEGAENVAFPDGEVSPLRLLVKTGLADKEGEWISFPEFSSTLKSSHRVHPIVRLAAWVKTIWSKVGVEEHRIVASLQCLSRLQLIDQAKFPFITAESGTTDFSRGEVFSKSGYYNDIMWLADTINHGYTLVLPQSQFNKLPKACSKLGVGQGSVANELH